MQTKSKEEEGNAKSLLMQETLYSIIQDMLSAFSPWSIADSEDQMIQKTTSDLVKMMEPTFEVPQKQLAVYLKLNGYRIRFNGQEWVWLLKENR